jgi:hypothetical protein
MSETVLAARVGALHRSGIRAVMALAAQRERAEVVADHNEPDPALHSAIALLALGSPVGPPPGE